MKTILSTLVACFVLAVAPSAMSAPITFVSGGGVVLNDTNGDILGSGDAVSLNVQDLVNDDSGGFSFEGSFSNAALQDLADGAITVIQFQPTTLGSIADLVLTFFQGVAPVQSFQITDATGAPINNIGNDVMFSLNLLGADTEIWYRMEGIAMPSVNGINPGIQMNITETPLPAALPFFLTGVAAYGVARRKKKQAA